MDMRLATRVYAFFDNIDVSSYVTFLDGGSVGGNITTNSTGYVKGICNAGTLMIQQNLRWRTGKRIFRLTSSSTNSQDRTAVFKHL